MQRKLFALGFFLLTLIAGFTILLAGSPVIKYHIALAAGSLSINSPVEGQALNDPVVTVSGTGDANAIVDVFIDNILDGTTAVSVYGSWSYSTSPLAEVAHEVYATTVGTEGEIIISDTVNFEIDLTPPQVTIITPGENDYVNLPMIEGITEPWSQVTAMVYGREHKVTADLLGEWSVFDPDLPEGSHTVTVSAVDRAGNQGESVDRSFTLDTTRPVVMPDIFPGEDMTTVPVDIAPYVRILENSPIDSEQLQYAFIITEYVSDTISNNVSGTVYSSVDADVYGEYGLRFVPESSLRLSTRYEVEVNPLVYDAAGNPIIPRSWNFTTASDVYNENPHGNYIDNVNTCVNCHAPHTASYTKLIQPKYPEDSLDYYCDACHDGTSAPQVSNWSMPNLHNSQISIDGVRGTSSCAGCHNPHLTWVPDNPNLLQDYFWYEHNDPTNPYLSDTSEEQLCESCHSASIKDDPRVNYVKYQYKKRNTATGVSDNYSLCLRCHNGIQAVNIAVYYNEPSVHFIVPLDASPIKGYMPCADCHETHGGENIRLLKNKLGHNHGREFSASGSWDAGVERRFCTSCHNGLTEMYGITVGFNSTIPGHESSNPDACSRCHGGSTAAAHAPQL